MAPVLPEAGRTGEAITALRQAAQALLQIKGGAPLDAVARDESFTQALGGFEMLRASLAAYNAAVAAVNAVIEARQRETQAANARDVETALAKLRAQKARHTDEGRELCAADERLQGDKTALNNEKAQVRELLDAHTQRVITQYGQSINRYLEKINAGFRITTPTHNYRGGKPNTSYQIVINNNAVDLGDAATPADRPSFRNTLSSGDRRRPLPSGCLTNASDGVDLPRNSSSWRKFALDMGEESFVDERLRWPGGICMHCGTDLNSTETTQEYVPSKCLLRKPYPVKSITIRSLPSCALGFSWTLDCERVLAGGVSR